VPGTGSYVLTPLSIQALLTRTGLKSVDWISTERVAPFGRLRAARDSTVGAIAVARPASRARDDVKAWAARCNGGLLERVARVGLDVKADIEGGEARLLDGLARSGEAVLGFVCEVLEPSFERGFVSDAGAKLKADAYMIPERRLVPSERVTSWRLNDRNCSSREDLGRPSSAYCRPDSLSNERTSRLYEGFARNPSSEADSAGVGPVPPAGSSSAARTRARARCSATSTVFVFSPRVFPICLALRSAP